MIKFYSVGQGLFISEHFRNHAIVFDCGGENQHLPRWVINSKLVGKTIDLLFISHYDRDHINGIFDLLEKCDVKSVVLPLVSDFSRFISFDSYPGRKNSRIKDFYENPVKYIENTYPSTRCHYQEGYNNEDNIQSDTIYTLQQLPNIIPSGSIITTPETDWIMKPFHRKFMTPRQENLFLTNLGIDPNDGFSVILEKWPNIKGKIKKALINAGVVTLNDINDYSMTLYSQNKESRALFLGDFNAKSYCKELKDEYKSYWNDITSLQVPHHGSFHSFSNELFSCGAVNYVISNKWTPRKVQDVDPKKVANIIKLHHKELKITDSTTIRIPNKKRMT